MSGEIPELGSEGQVTESHRKEVREEWHGEAGESSVSKLPEVGRGRRRV